MPTKISVTRSLLQDLHNKTILLKHNSPPPVDGRYGWLNESIEMNFYTPVVVEQNVGLYGGPYKPMVGGRRSSGFTSVGAFTYSYSALPDGLTVGRYCSISTGLKFTDSSHPLNLLTTSAFTFRPQNNLFKDFVTEPVLEHAHGYSALHKSYPKIDHDVWVGANVTVSMGVHVGTGAVLASGSVVTKDVPPYAIVGGNPAQVIRFRFEEATIGELLESRWWEYDPKKVFRSLRAGSKGVLENIRADMGDPYSFLQVKLS